MKPICLLLTALFISQIIFSQAPNYRLTWGEEMKLKKGTSDLDILTADKSGVYFAERRMARSLVSIGGPGTSHKLYKVDKNFGEVFDKEYKKELKGIDFESFETLGDDLFLFASDYVRKEKIFKLYGAKLDKSNGDLLGDFSELGSYPLESKRDDYDMKVSPIHNGKSFLLVSNISASDRTSLGISVLDKNLKNISNTVINLSYPKDLYELQDVQITKNNKIILLGKEFEETQIGKKKRKRLVFKQFVMGIYNVSGTKEKDVKIDSDDRYIISGKLIETPAAEMLLAGFYSNNAKKEDLNGFFINKVDPDKGELLVSSFKEISSNMLGKNYVEDAADEDDEIKENKKQAKKAKDDDDDEEFPNSFIIKTVDINPADNSIIITGEVSKYAFYSYTNSSYNGRTWTTTTTYVHRFTNRDIMIINADAVGKIKWLNVLPKSQYEELRSSSSRSGSGISFSYDRMGYFAGGGGMPFYSSYKSMLYNNNLVLLFNDHTSNNVNAEYGDKVKTVMNFRKKSNVYGVSIDLNSGKMTRKVIGSNNEETILMPRHSLIVNNEVVVPSWRLHLLGKTELKFAKIVVK